MCEAEKLKEIIGMTEEPTEKKKPQGCSLVAKLNLIQWMIHSSRLGCLLKSFIHQSLTVEDDCLSLIALPACLKMANEAYLESTGSTAARTCFHVGWVALNS